MRHRLHMRGCSWFFCNSKWLQRLLRAERTGRGGTLDATRIGRTGIVRLTTVVQRSDHAAATAVRDFGRSECRNLPKLTVAPAWACS
jgi:hypothetical protein